MLRRPGAVVLDVAARDERDEELVVAFPLPHAHLRKQRGARPAGGVAEEDENREPGGAKIAQREQLAAQVRQSELGRLVADGRSRSLLRLELVEADQRAPVSPEHDHEQPGLGRRNQRQAATAASIGSPAHAIALGPAEARPPATTAAAQPRSPVFRASVIGPIGFA